MKVQRNQETRHASCLVWCFIGPLPLQYVAATRRILDARALYLYVCCSIPEVFIMAHDGLFFCEVSESWHSISRSPEKMHATAWRRLTWEFSTVLPMDMPFSYLGRVFHKIVSFTKIQNAKSYKYCLHQPKSVCGGHDWIIEINLTHCNSL